MKKEKQRTFKHLTWTDLLMIEKLLLKKKYKPEEIAEIIGCTIMTIYSYIRKGVFLNLSLEQVSPGKKRKKDKVKRAKRVKGTSIEKRPEEVDSRETFGHWEMDTVVGQSTNKKSLLVLTERKTRYEIVEVLKEHTAAEVVKAMNRIEKRYKGGFYSIFRTITIDNGSEFSDFDGIEKALRRKKKRTKTYFCHPYCSFERGSNENQNKLIRKFYPKGSDFDTTLNRREVKAVEQWINQYPRRLFSGKTAEMLFIQECQKLEAA